MDITNIRALGILEQRILHHAKKQAVLAENVASADIPNYKRKDIKPPNFGNLVKDAQNNVSIAITNPNHIQPSNKGGGPVFETGDKVKMDMEAIEIMKNSNEFAQSTQSYKKFLSLIAAVTNSGGG